MEPHGTAAHPPGQPHPLQHGQLVPVRHGGAPQQVPQHHLPVARRHRQQVLAVLGDVQQPHALAVCVGQRGEQHQVVERVVHVDVEVQRGREDLGAIIGGEQHAGDAVQGVVGRVHDAQQALQVGHHQHAAVQGAGLRPLVPAHLPAEAHDDDVSVGRVAGGPGHVGQGDAGQQAALLQAPHPQGLVVARRHTLLPEGVRAQRVQLVSEVAGHQQLAQEGRRGRGVGIGHRDGVHVPSRVQLKLADLAGRGGIQHLAVQLVDTEGLVSPHPAQRH
mmetsp:Transcript_13865/g.18794  ORF Transcript_13865/g.18794 Transcript_13865/m.18794 type:complete len:275 (-) Transcript_13865:1109-1933(-)